MLQDELFNDLHYWGGGCPTADEELMAKYLLPQPTRAAVGAAAAAQRGRQRGAAVRDGQPSPAAGSPLQAGGSPDFITSYNPFAVN